QPGRPGLLAAGEETHVGPGRVPRGARRAAINAGAEHPGDEAAVVSPVAAQHRRPCLFGLDSGLVNARMVPMFAVPMRDRLLAIVCALPPGKAGRQGRRRRFGCHGRNNDRTPASRKTLLLMGHARSPRSMARMPAPPGPRVPPLALKAFGGEKARMTGSFGKMARLLAAIALILLAPFAASADPADIDAAARGVVRVVIVDIQG